MLYKEKRFVVGITGASGIVLAQKLIIALAQAGHFIELIISQHALYTAAFELGSQYTTPKKIVDSFPDQIQKRITLHPIQDIGCAVASGSYLVDGMIIIPCSMATLAAVAIGLGDNALRRAADVTIKEKRALVIVPRESPLSEIHLENLLKLARLGATIVPPMPAWYTTPTTLEDIEHFIVGKVLDALHLPHELYKRWK
jgi:4-hydroxy-3-polyprenylbenzoate decarboxylase